jgi:hypothetical protein
MRPVNPLNRTDLLEKAERWPVPVVILVAVCLAMTATAVWAQAKPQARTIEGTTLAPGD